MYRYTYFYIESKVKSSGVNFKKLWNDFKRFLVRSFFLEKWCRRAKGDIQILNFLDYFKEQWLKENFSWYEGAAPEGPSTNNGIEGTNAVIKRNYTLRERLPVGQFLRTLSDMVKIQKRKRGRPSLSMRALIVQWGKHLPCTQSIISTCTQVLMFLLAGFMKCM